MQHTKSHTNKAHCSLCRAGFVKWQSNQRCNAS